MLKNSYWSLILYVSVRCLPGTQIHIAFLLKFRHCWNSFALIEWLCHSKLGTFSNFLYENLAKGTHWIFIVWLACLSLTGNYCITAFLVILSLLSQLCFVLSQLNQISSPKIRVVFIFLYTFILLKTDHLHIISLHFIINFFASLI